MFKDSDAWILLAILYNHGSGSADLQAIIETADFINHAIPTYEEIKNGLGRLAEAGLIREQRGKFKITQLVLSAYSQTHTMRRPVQKELEDLIGFLKNYSGQKKSPFPVSQLKSITLASYEKAIANYLKWFDEYLETKNRNIKRKKTDK